MNCSMPADFLLIGMGLFDLKQTIQPSGYRAGQVAPSVRCVPCKQEDPSLISRTDVFCFLFSVFFLPSNCGTVHDNPVTTEEEA